MDQDLISCNDEIKGMQSPDDGVDPESLSNFTKKLTPENLSSYTFPEFFNPPNDVLGQSKKHNKWVMVECEKSVLTPPRSDNPADKRKWMDQKFIMKVEGEDTPRYISIKNYNGYIKERFSRFAILKQKYKI